MPSSSDLSELLNNETLRTLLALLPGLLSVAIVQMLTIKEQRSALERIIQALLFTFVVHVVWQLFIVFVSFIFWLVHGCSYHNWCWRQIGFSNTWTLIGLGFIGFCVGIVAATMINNDLVHSLLRRFGFTKKSSRPSEWYDSFYRWDKYVVVHLNDGRRVFGWPRLYPDSADSGHLVLEDAEWLKDDGKSVNEQVRVTLMIPAAMITFVEFVNPRETNMKDDNNE